MISYFGMKLFKCKNPQHANIVALSHTDTILVRQNICCGVSAIIMGYSLSM